MMKYPDLLLTQIKHTDYPIWRMTLKKYRGFFGKIIVYFNENNRFPYLDHFIHDAMADLGNIVFLDQAEMDWGKQDWRDISTNEMLKYSDSEWVCSVEQDWFAKDWDKLFDAVEKASETHGLIGWENQAGQYIHPSFFFIKREMLEKTRKDFSAKEGVDHFGLITRDVKAMGGKIISTQELGFRDVSTPNETDCFHLGSVNFNYLNGLDDPTLYFPQGRCFLCL